VSPLNDLAHRVRSLVLWRRQDRELDEEMRFHIEREVEERLRRGERPAAARRAALLAFGGVDRFAEETRDARGVSPLMDLGADIRYALRGLRRNPGFASAAILVLGIGIGVATATFAVVDAVLIAELPVPHADRMVRVYPKPTRTMANLSVVDFLAIREARSFAGVGALAPRDMALSGVGDPRLVPAGRVTAGFFEALSVRPAAGRLIEATDEAPGAPAVVVLTHGLATRLFGAPDTAVGRALTLDGRSHAVVGVLPAGVADRAGLAGVRAELWPALQLSTPTRRGPFWIRGIARLGDGVTLDAARRELNGISARLFPIWAASFQDREVQFTPVPLRAAIVGSADLRVSLFAGAVGLVLLVAVVNVATLVLVRAAARGPELAVRTALGAPRDRVARLLVVEGLTLTALAGAGGAVLAALAVRLAGALAPSLPRLAEVRFGPGAIGFAVVCTIVAGLVVSLSPLAGVGRWGATPLRADARRTGESRRSGSLRGALVVGEFALALPLLFGAGLLLNSLLRLQRVDPGFDPSGVVSTSVSLPAARYSDGAAAAFWRRVETAAAELPAVAAAGLSTELPPDEPSNENNFDLVDDPVPPGAAQPSAPWAGVTNGYFAALDVPLLDGRLFTAGDSGPAPPVVLVSRAWAERFFPRGDAVGRQLVEGGCLSCPLTTVVGVVGDVKYSGIRNSAEAVYSPIAQWGARSAHIVARGRAGAAEVQEALRNLVRRLDSELPVAEATLTGRLDAELANPRRWTIVIGGFGAAAALLAAIGVFGLMSFVVRQRRREIGVRLALGADQAAVTWMVVRRGMRLAGLGALLGVVLAAVGARWLRVLLFQVAVTDPVTLGAVATILLGAALVACWVPGRRAARISPVEAIAAE
jgi:putative ABC transport system permease protein